jgi:hypothetical protein
MSKAWMLYNHYYNVNSPAISTTTVNKSKINNVTSDYNTELQKCCAEQLNLLITDQKTLEESLDILVKEEF